MKLSDFILTKTVGTCPIDWQYFAEVTVMTTTGFLWWKKTNIERRTIHRNFAEFWHFVDDGSSTPSFQAEDLERGYRARQILGLHGS